MMKPMKKTTNTIDQKIKQLQEQKKALALKQAITFVRELTKIVTADADLQTVLGLVATEWDNASSQQKEEWRHKGAQFCKSRSAKVLSSDQSWESVACSVS